MNTLVTDTGVRMVRGGGRSYAPLFAYDPVELWKVVAQKSAKRFFRDKYSEVRI